MKPDHGLQTRFLLSLVLLLMLLLFLHVAAMVSAQPAADLLSETLPVLSIDPQELTVRPSQPFTLSVWVENAVDLFQFHFSLEFDPDPVNITAVGLGPFLGSSGRVPHNILQDINNVTGGVFLRADTLGVTRGASGDGQLAVITGTAGTTLGDSGFRFLTASLFNSGHERTTPELRQGVVHVRETGPEQTATSTPTVTQTPTPTWTLRPSPTPSGTPTRTGTPTATATLNSSTGVRTYLPAIRKKPNCCQLYESNDTYLDAWGPLQIGRQYQACHCEGESEDWYYLDMEAGQAIRVDLAVPSVADYDLYLYRAGVWDHPAASSDRFGSGVDEQVSYVAALGDRYYVRVFAYQGHSAVDPYVLRVSQ